MDQKRPIPCILEATTLCPSYWALSPFNSIVLSTLPYSQSYPNPPKVWFWFWGFGCCGKYPDEGNLMERGLTKLHHVGAEGPSSQQSSRYLITLYSQSRSSSGMLAFHSISPFVFSSGAVQPVIHGVAHVQGGASHFSSPTKEKNPHSHAQRPFWSTQSLPGPPFPGNSKSCHSDNQH